MLELVLLNIEKLVYGGDGLARLPADDSGRGKTAFIPFVLPGEQVEAAAKEEKPGFLRATLERVVEASSHRVTPGCEYFQQCGGCHYQHAEYAEQVAIKTSILRETLLRTAKLDWQDAIDEVTGEPWNYRNRTRMRVRSAPFAIGYNRFNSDIVLPVQRCPISSPLINQAITTVWQEGAEQPPPEQLREVEFFANDDDSQLLLEFYVERGADTEATLAWAKALRSRLPAIAGISLMVEGPGGPRRMHSVGASSLHYQVDKFKFRVSSGSFFQTNRFLVAALSKLVTSNLSGGILFDLYAGAGLFSSPLRSKFERIFAVEGSDFSFADLKLNSADGIEPIRGAVDAFLRQAPVKLSGRDAIIADPPRAGLGERVARELGKLKAGQMVYVSCDPATLARDLKVLIESGYRVRQIHLVDLFPQTFHLETVVHLER